MNACKTVYTFLMWDYVQSKSASKIASVSLLSVLFWDEKAIKTYNKHSSMQYIPTFQSFFPLLKEVRLVKSNFQSVYSQSVVPLSFKLGDGSKLGLCVMSTK